VPGMSCERLSRGAFSTGASVHAVGKLTESKGRDQKYDIVARELVLLGSSDPMVWTLINIPMGNGLSHCCSTGLPNSEGAYDCRLSSRQGPFPTPDGRLCAYAPGSGSRRRTPSILVPSKLKLLVLGGWLLSVHRVTVSQKCMPL